MAERTSADVQAEISAARVKIDQLTREAQRLQLLERDEEWAGSADAPILVTARDGVDGGVVLSLWSDGPRMAGQAALGAADVLSLGGWLQERSAPDTP